MNILIVSSFLPYPLFSGGHIRLYNLVKELSKRHAITLICEKRKYQTENDVKEIEKLCEVIWVKREKQWSIKNILQSGFSSYPFLMAGHTNSQMRKRIEDVLKQKKLDVIHVETFYVMQNMPEVETPIVLVEHNIEYLVYKRFAKTAPIVLKPLLFIDILKMKYWEQKFWRQTTKLVAVSDEDKGLMKRKDVIVVPNGVDIDRFKIKDLRFKNKEKKILFIGDFRWVQNRDAAEWILKEIWPEISSKLKVESSKLILWIVGREIPESIKKLTNAQNVVFDENAPKETSEIFRKADILLAPIRVGGGTSFKILEAMASGVPVITTHLGIEGIDAENDKSVLISDDALGLASKTIDVLKNEEEYQRISINARRLIEEKYDWKIIVEKLESVYQEAVQGV